MADEEKDDTAVAEAPAKAPAKKSAAKPRARKAAAEIEASPLNVSSFDAQGERSGEIRLPESVFGQEPNNSVMHQAYLRQLANARQGTAKTKKRGEVSGGGAKPYRQKGTGRARHGSTREPSWVGGGTVFGPQPRSFAQRMPRKMRRLALRSALAVKANEGRVAILDGFELEEPKTRVVVDLLHAAGVETSALAVKANEGRVAVLDGFELEEPKTRLVVDLLHAAGVETSALIVLASSNDLVQRSFNNLPWAKVVLARNLNLYDLFTHEHLVITKDSLELLEENFESPTKSGDFAGTPRRKKEKPSK